MSKPYNRRRFLQTSLMATIGTATVNPSFAWPKSGQFRLMNTPSDRALSPFLLVEDLLRLLQLTDIHKTVRQAFTVNREYFQLGKAWSIDKDELMQLARDSRALWEDENLQDQAQTQFTLVSGWIAHRVIERKLMGEKTKHSRIATGGVAEAVLYQDTYLMKMLQNADPHRKKLAVDQPITEVEPTAVAELFHLIQQRNLIRMHTLRPEFSDIEKWLGEFLAYYHQLKKDNLAYAKVYCLPDPAKVKKYIYQSNFYDEQDSIIQTPRSLQMAMVTRMKSWNQASARPKSIYGQVLQDLLQRMIIWSDYMIGKASDDQFRATMII